MEKNTMYAKMGIRLNLENDVHKVPLDDIFDHVPSVNCHCSPQQSDENKRDIREGKSEVSVWLHKMIRNSLN